MLMRRRLQAANRIRQHTHTRNDVSIHRLETARHNTMGLEECLSVMPKSICSGRAKGKLKNTLEDIKRGISIKEKPPNIQMTPSDRTYAILANERGLGLEVDAYVQPMKPYDSGKAEGDGKDTEKMAQKVLKVPEITNTSKDKINEDFYESVRGDSIAVTSDGRASEDRSDDTDCAAPTTHQMDACDFIPSQVSHPDKDLRPLAFRKYTAERKRSTPESQDIKISLMTKRHNLASTNANKLHSYATRSKNPNSGVRCKTSMGHYRTTPEQTTRTTKSAGFLRRHQELDTGDSILTEACLAALSARLDTYVTENKTRKFESEVTSWHPTTRQAVVNYKPDNSLGSSVFFRACQLSRNCLVTLMLDECSADLELTGLFSASDDGAGLQVTPLWCAAASSNLDLVRLLTSFGANVNATSWSGCTAVRAACCASSFPVVAFLIAHGANIHAKDPDGVTCLMSAVTSLETVRLLVHHGLGLSEVDIRGNTALHYAAEAGRLDTVRMLVEMGANPRTDNKVRCRPVHTAAKYGKRDVVEYFIKVATPSLEELIDIFLVLGSVCIIIDNDYFNWYLYWHKAFELRRLNNKAPRIQFRKSALSDFLEMQDISGDEFSRNFYHHEALCMQALLVYERIRGSSDDNFVNLLLYSGGICADSKNFKQAINLWKSAYKIQLEKHANTSSKSKCTDMLNSNIINCLRLLLKILHYINQEMNSSGENSPCSQKPTFVSENTISDLFPATCQHISQLNEILRNNESENRRYRDLFGVFLKIILAIFYGYLKIFPAASRSSEVGTYLQKLIRLNPRGGKDEPLLHMCLDSQILQSYETGLKIVTSRKCQNYTMCEILLLLGADPLATDCDGNTVLHRAVIVYNQGLILDSSFFRMLLRLGVHADQVNNRLEKARDLLQPGDDLRHVIQQTALKCLAARKIITHNISYMGEVPKSLYSFIELHTCRCMDSDNASRCGH